MRTKRNPVLLLVLLLILTLQAGAQFSIVVDAKKDSFYTRLSTVDEGFLHIPHTAFLPMSGAMPQDDNDLSADVWLAWDSAYFYAYVEVTDDIVKVNCPYRPDNDCLELKFDPDPTRKSWSGIVNARLSALDSAAAEDRSGVDNLYSERHLSAEASSPGNYARRRTPSGYVLELRLSWKWISAEGKQVEVGPGNIFGISVTIHENDSDTRDGSIQWSVGMADEVWNTPQLLGSAEFRPDHTIRLIRHNTIDPTAFRGKTYLCDAKFRTYRGKDVALENWRYHSGDNPEWADPSYDDSSWRIVYPTIKKGESPQEDWEGIGWFRITIAVDSSVQGVPLELRMRQLGASEVFLDGRLLYTFGTVGTSRDSEQTFLIRNPRPMSFRESGIHLLAVRYSNFMTDDLHTFRANGGFHCWLVGDLDSVIVDHARVIRDFSLYQGIFTVVPLLLMLLHLFLFLFHRHARENLYFSAFMLFWAMVVFSDFQNVFVGTLPEAILFKRIHLFAVAPAVVFGLLTMYTSVFARVPKQFILFVVGGTITTAALYMWPSERAVGYAYYVLYGLTVLETSRLFITAGRERWRQRWVTFIGYSAFMITFTYQILMSLGTVPRIGEYGAIYPYGLLILSMALSIDLSRRFAKTTRDLKQKLIEVEELSRKTLEQERHAKEEEVARKVLEADIARKTKELEEARNLQLSMLPRSLPSVPHLDVGVYMQPANEVGGDYYDFHRAPDGTLTVAVGDATGHGMRAGTMVATIKGLFCALGGRLAIVPFLDACTYAIRDMHLGNLYMALMIARIHRTRMTVASAGMPPMFIYRHADRRAERVVLKGMPLGAHAGFPYAEWETTLAPGDTVLMMSDGFPELFNDHQECFDYQRVQPLFEEIAHETPDEIIAHLKTAGETWMNGNHQNDDITFVVLKVNDADRD